MEANDASSMKASFASSAMISALERGPDLGPEPDDETVTTAMSDALLGKGPTVQLTLARTCVEADAVNEYAKSVCGPGPLARIQLPDASSVCQEIDGDIAPSQPATSATNDTDSPTEAVRSEPMLTEAAANAWGHAANAAAHTKIERNFFIGGRRWEIGYLPPGFVT